MGTVKASDDAPRLSRPPLAVAYYYLIESPLVLAYNAASYRFGETFFPLTVHVAVFIGLLYPRLFTTASALLGTGIRKGRTGLRRA